MLRFTQIEANRYGFDPTIPAGRAPNTRVPTSIVAHSPNYSGRMLLFDYSFTENAGERTDVFKVFTGLESGQSISDRMLLLNHGGDILNLDFDDAVEMNGSLVWTFIDDSDYDNFNSWITTALPSLSSIIQVFMGIVDSDATNIDFSDHTITQVFSGNEPRYRFGGTILSDENPLEVISAFERAMNGRVVLLADGTARGYVGRVRQATAILSENDCVGSPVYHVLSSPKEYFNVATASIRVWPLYISKDVTLSDETTPN